MLLPYQEEYIENLKQIMALSVLKSPKTGSFEEYEQQQKEAAVRIRVLKMRNMELVRQEMLPVLDDLVVQDEGVIDGLFQFAEILMTGNTWLDVGLNCQIHQALLSYARHKKDRNMIIRELYWLGMGRYNQLKILYEIRDDVMDKYNYQMRLCFLECSTYLKYFDEIDDEETRGYIIRSKGNLSLGSFHKVEEKLTVIRQTLDVLHDDYYRELAPGLPWDVFLKKMHQQMTTIRSNADQLTPEEMELVLESTHIIYDIQFEEAQKTGKQPNVRWLWNYYAMEYSYGLRTLPEMIGILEEFIEKASPEDTSESGMYSMLTLTLQYPNYLKRSSDPQMLWKRKDYINWAYKRMMDYICVNRKAFDDMTMFYLRQVAVGFSEIEGMLSYERLLLEVLPKCCPEEYVCSLVVAEIAVAFCETVYEEEPDFFDEIPHIGKLAPGEEKKEELLSYTRNCALLHNMGMLYFTGFTFREGRDLLAMEDELLQLHTVIGAYNLQRRNSTERYADVALGHHCSYDGSRGYPERYRRQDSPYRQMVDVIALAAWLEETTNACNFGYREGRTYEEAVAEALRQEGKLFSPLLTVRLHDAAFSDRLKSICETGGARAYRNLYELQQKEE